jgi:hypothetical protein
MEFDEFLREFEILSHSLEIKSNNYSKLRAWKKKNGCVLRYNSVVFDSSLKGVQAIPRRITSSCEEKRVYEK